MPVVRARADGHIRASVRGPCQPRLHRRVARVDAAALTIPVRCHQVFSPNRWLCGSVTASSPTSPRPMSCGHGDIVSPPCDTQERAAPRRFRATAQARRSRPAWKRGQRDAATPTLETPLEKTWRPPFHHPRSQGRSTPRAAGRQGWIPGGHGRDPHESWSLFVELPTQWSSKACERSSVCHSRGRRGRSRRRWSSAA